MGLCLQHEVIVAHGTPTLHLAHILDFIIGQLTGVSHVLTQLMGLLQIFGNDGDVTGACHTLTHHHVHHLERLHEHGDTQSCQRQGLPVQRGAAGADNACHALRSLVHHACLDLQCPLIGKPAVGKHLPQTVRAYRERGDGDDQTVTGCHLCHNGIHVILAAENTLGGLLLHHDLHHAGLAAGAGIDFRIVEIEPNYFRALCLAGHQRLFQQDFRVAAGSSAVDTHNFHVLPPPLIYSVLPLVPKFIVA